MSLWFRRTQGLDSGTMREIAEDAGVEWDYQLIVYRSHAIGYADADSADVDNIQNTAQELLGYRPVEIEEPDKPETDDE